MHPIIQVWRESLVRLLQFYDSKRPRLSYFYPTLFFLFVVLNIACYWWALLTAFPNLMEGQGRFYYYKVQFPVGLLGALFDSLSFFITIFIVRRAVESHSVNSYLGHLSIDLVIAVLATFWVLFVFSVSGWILGTLNHEHVSLSARNGEHLQLLTDAIERPWENLRNIYFGLIMGISAMLPTCGHLYMCGRAVTRVMSGHSIA